MANKQNNALSIITLNIQGLRAPDHRHTLFSWLNCVKADIIALQETHSTSQDEFRSWVTEESSANNNFQRYSVVSSPGSIRSRGVAVLYKPSLEVQRVITDDEGRFVIIFFSDAASNSSPFQFINIYGPNRKQLGEEFFESLFLQIDPAMPSILCGDFNTVVNPHLDRLGCNPSSYWAYNWPRSLRLLTERCDLIDIWRSKHPDERNYTWSRANGSQASRLDMFWISSPLSMHVLDVDIFPFFRSDHSYVYLRVALPSMPDRGPGVWKLNASLLKNKAYEAQICDFWQSWQDEKSSFPSLAVWWDAGKKRIKHLSRAFSKQKAHARRQRIKSLEHTLFHLTRRQREGEDVHDLLQDVKADLELEHQHAAQGARIRSREQWAEEGETSSSYFFRLEKTRATKKLFTSIRNAQGIVVRSISAIIRVWCLFYVHLFTACVLVPNDQDFFINSLDLSLSQAESDLCEGEITQEECQRALSSMKNNKSPGIDGLPYEFYVHFWSTLGPDLVSVYNDCFVSGRLSFSQRSGLITLLYKKGDKLDTKNWRPISLLCTDYKILAKVLTNRLSAVISSVTGPEQVCGIPGRLSSENIRVLKDVVDHANRTKVGAALISLDQEKAFDRVDWSFMLRVLETMNFGPSFCNWVRLLYANVFSQILVNGFKSDLFPVFRGVRQGCPLSPLLYVLVAETIASAIRKDASIDGFLLPDHNRIKLFQYADDTSVLVMSDQSLRSLFSLFERYERASGAKLNVGKSHGLLLGAWKERVNMPIELNWSKECITVLGCRIGNDMNPDWDSLITKFEDQLSVWKQRQLSFRGRALVANMLGLSLFWYQATIFDVPKTVITRINKILFPFVWSKKREWMARTSVTQPIRDGGLGVVDVARKVSSLRSIWIKRCLSSPTPHPWTSFFNHHVSNTFVNDDVMSLLGRDSVPAYKIKKLPPFYASVVRTWVDLKGCRIDNRWVIPRSDIDPLPIEELTARFTYLFLAKSNHVEHRSVAKFQDLGIPVVWNRVWASLHLWRFVRSVQDTAWLSFHGILPTVDRLSRFGMNVNPACFCGQPESLCHLFVSCPFATEILSWFVAQLCKCCPTATLSSSQILFGFDSASRVPIVFTALLGILRHHIWLARNSHRFEGIPPDVPTTLKKAKSTFRFLVRMHKRHHPPDRFVVDWLADGVIGSLSEQDWIRFTRDFIT
jgi:exonuclease III